MLNKRVSIKKFNLKRLDRNSLKRKRNCYVKNKRGITKY